MCACVCERERVCVCVCIGVMIMLEGASERQRVGVDILHDVARHDLGRNCSGMPLR